MANATEYNMNRDSPQKSQNQNTVETIDSATISTLKRNPKIEFCKTDLLKLLTYLEGELQARDIVIATLKSEKLKQFLVQNKHLSQQNQNDPVAALHRDSFAVIDSSREAEMYLLVNDQLNGFHNLVHQQRRSQARVARVLKDAEIRHRKEIELEVQNRKKYEREYYKLNDVLEAEKNRHKQIVLFLLAERKKIIMKYVEERKRSEDLAQILAEEKSRVDAMAEGLEEESKKSLQMEAELEKQLAQFFVETQQLKGNLGKQERRCKELETELEKSQKENVILRQQLNELRQMSSSPALPDAVSQSSGNPSAAGLHCVTPMMTSIAKVVQPTATVSSVPVSGPMTGIARSVSPGQHVRYVMYPSMSPTAHGTQVVNSGKLGDIIQQSHIPSPVINTQVERPVAPSATVRSATICNSPHPKLASSPIAKNHSGESGGGGGGSMSTVARKPIPLGRGVPPPVPPNKPIVPPKKEGILGRKVDADSADSKNSASQIRPPSLPIGKVKLSNSIEKPNEQAKNDLMAENPG